MRISGPAGDRVGAGIVHYCCCLCLRCPLVSGLTWCGRSGPKRKVSAASAAASDGVSDASSQKVSLISILANIVMSVMVSTSQVLTGPRSRYENGAGIRATVFVWSGDSVDKVAYHQI